MAMAAHQPSNLWVPFNNGFECNPVVGVCVAVYETRPDIKGRMVHEEHCRAVWCGCEALVEPFLALAAEIAFPLFGFRRIEGQ